MARENRYVPIPSRLPLASRTLARQGWPASRPMSCAALCQLQHKGIARSVNQSCQYTPQRFCVMKVATVLHWRGGGDTIPEMPRRGASADTLVPFARTMHPEPASRRSPASVRRRSHQRRARDSRADAFRRQPSQFQIVHRWAASVGPTVANTTRDSN